MNWKRFAKKNLIPFYSPVYNIRDLVTKVQDNGLIEGIKGKIREDYIEDMPIISHVYELGKKEGTYIGKKEGYEQASNAYEKKLLKQAEAFLNQRNNSKMEVEELNNLLDEYENYIQQLEDKCESLTREQLILLNKLKIMQNKLNTYKFRECFAEEDINRIQNTIEMQFSKLAVEHLLTEKEGSIVCETISEKLNPKTLNALLISSNPEKYVHRLIEDTIEIVLKKRKNINAHNDENVIENLRKEEDIRCSNDPSPTVYKYDTENSDKHNCNIDTNKEYYSSDVKNTTSILPEYDEKGFIKNTAKHRNGTKYDDEGFNKYGYDKDGYDNNGLDKCGYDRYGNKKCSLSKSNEIIDNSSKYDERGFIKNTAKHKNGTKYDDEGFDKYGYDKDGYDKNGFDKCGYDRYGNKKYSLSKSNGIIDNSSKYDERGFIKNTAKHKNGTKYDDEGFDKYGYDKDGYDKNGFDKFGHAKKTL